MGRELVIYAEVGMAKALGKSVSGKEGETVLLHQGAGPLRKTF